MEQSLHKLTDMDFPVSIIEHYKSKNRELFSPHLHEDHLQIFYITQGILNIFSNQTMHELKKGDILIINKNELHYGECISDTSRYYVFRVDLKQLLSCQISPLNVRYINALNRGQVLFKNEVIDTEIVKSLMNMINLISQKEVGYELGLLSELFRMLFILIKSWTGQYYSQQEADLLMKKTKRFTAVLDFMELHYQEPISLNTLAKQAHMQESTFCRAFKESIGRTPIDYLNFIRIKKAVLLLNQGLCNVTEAGMSVGFDDINYFSRVFKKYMNQSPAHYIKNDGKLYI